MRPALGSFCSTNRKYCLLRVGAAGERNFLLRGLGRAATADPLRGSAEIFQDLIGDKSHGVGLPAPWLQFRSRLFERAPRLFCSGTAVVQAAATECVPGRDQRLEAIPPIGVYVAATALEKQITVRLI